MRKRRTNQEFINECLLVHNNKYDYSQVEHTKMHNYIKIGCPIHGIFTQTSNEHFRGAGCKECAILLNQFLQKDTTESFIKKAMLIHGDKYDYSKCIYGKNAHEKVTVVCKKHGEFKISPNSHLSKKSNCYLCAREKCGWTKTTWKKACENRISKLYIIRCFNKNESFYKIGITCKNIKTRFGCKSQMPYNIEIIKIIESGDSDYIFNLEKKLHKINRKYEYKPLIFFDG